MMYHFAQLYLLRPLDTRSKWWFPTSGRYFTCWTVFPLKVANNFEEEDIGWQFMCSRDFNVDWNCATREATESAKFASEKHFLGESGNAWGLVG